MNADELYALLPAIHRIQDDKAGQPLRAFIELFARELEALGQSLDQLYDDQFIETCAPWAAPYIGDLIGWRPIRVDVSPALRGLNSPRAEIGNTIAFRRRKGTALMLEELASNTTGWPAHAVEFFEQLATTQHMNHVRLHAPASAAVRSLPRMLAVRGDAGAFNGVAHTAEVRRPQASERAGGGRFNIPHIGLLLWRVRPQRLHDLPLVADPGDASGTRWRLHPLGLDLALVRRPLQEDSIDQLARADHVPAPLRIRELALQLRQAQATSDVVHSTLDFGAGRSVELRQSAAVLAINAAGPAVPPGSPPSPSIPRLRAADLRDVPGGWAHAADVLPDEIAIDPERGRILLGSAQATRHAAAPISASFHYGLLRDIGGGPYVREPAGAQHTEQRSASGGVAWQPLLDALPATSARLLITDSLAHDETPVLRVPGVSAAGAAGLQRVITASPATRPVLRAAGDVLLDIGARGTLVLEGLLVSGGALRVPLAADTEPRLLVLRDCTLLQGLVVLDPSLAVRLERCISGPLQVHPLARCELLDCVVDAHDPQALAYGAPAGSGDFGAPLSLHECTLIGRVSALEMPIASNTIFHGQAAGAGTSAQVPLQVQRRQSGCVRFCWLPPGAITPRRHRCLPDAAHPGVLPQFASLRWGDALYASLRPASGRALFTGADDDGEIGVMHALQQPLREANLQLRLQEYLRFGLEAGVFHAT